MTYRLRVAVAYEHVIFDLDGTLVDSRADLSAAVNHALRALERPAVPLETVSSYVGEGARVLMQRALGVAHQERIEEGLGLFMIHYREHLLDHTRPYPGIRDLLAALVARRIALSVLSNKPEAMSRAVLEGLGVLHHFVAVVGGDSLPVHKPDPGGIEHLRSLTATPRTRVLVVGDSAIDARTAQAAGVAFCGVAWGLAPASLRAVHAQRIIAHPGELLAIVECG